MAVTKHQFQQLSEMGIDLWQPRSDAAFVHPFSECHSGSQSTDNIEALAATPSVNELKQTHKAPAVDFDTLKNQPLFHDIILSIGLSLGEVIPAKTHLELGLLRWQFSPDKQIEITDKVLTTPALSELAASGTLKRQLWQLLQEHSL